MFAERHLASLLPLRLPHWRLNRVMAMLLHRPQPLRPRCIDDHSIRVYRRMLLELLAAGDDEEKLNAVKEELPAVYEAHRYHYAPELQMRQAIEARLLTRESHEEIASRFGADPKAIEYHGSLFFDIRDALDHWGWVSPMIRSRMRYDEESGCSRAEAERGFVLRLFGYIGGPLVLDTFLNPLSATKRPESAEDVRAWSEEAVTHLVRTMGTAAAATIELTNENKIHLLRLGQREMLNRKRNSAPSRAGSTTAIEEGCKAAHAILERSGDQYAELLLKTGG